MKASPGFVLQLAAISARSHLSCVMAFLRTDSKGPTSTANAPHSRADVARALSVSGGWGRHQSTPESQNIVESVEGGKTGVWGRRQMCRRTQTKRSIESDVDQAEATEHEAVVVTAHTSTANRNRRVEKQVVLVQGVLRKIRRLLSAIVDIAMLKRLRQLRQARKGVRQHPGPIPVQYRAMLQDLRTEIAARPGLERRARTVNHELDTNTLARYLEAAYWSLEHDGKRVVDHISETIAWRELNGAHRLTKEDVIARGSKGAIVVKGHDVCRRPVVYFSPALDGNLDGDDSAKLMIYTLERAIRLMPRGTWQYTIVIDCQGLGLGHLPPLPYTKKMFKMLSSHYPMRLGNVLFSNAGPGMMLCWRVVSPLLQKRTKLKMRFIPSSKLDMMHNFIEPSQLLPFVGGQSSFVLDPDIYFSSDAASL